MECKNPIPCEHKLHNTCKGFKIRIVDKYYEIRIFVNDRLITRVNYSYITKESATIIATNIIKTVLEKEVDDDLL